MGILDRARRIAEAYWNDRPTRHAELPPDDEAENLKRIIDELSGEKKHSQKDNFKEDFKSNSQRNSGAHNPDAAKFKSAYSILGVTESATNDEIKTAFKKKMRQHHPDKAATLDKTQQAAAQKKSQEINEAYQFLKTARGI